MTLEDFTRRGTAVQAAVDEAIADAQPAADVLIGVLPTRAYNALRHGGGPYKGQITIGQLRQARPHRLLTIPNFSIKSLNAIIAALDARGITHQLGPQRRPR